MTAAMRESVAGPRPQELRLAVVAPSAVPAATLWVSAPAREGVAPTTPLLGLPLARRVALSAFRAGFARVLFEAASGSDLSGALSRTGAEVVPPSGPFPEIPPGRLVLLAPGVIPQVAWLKSLLARPVETGVFPLYEVEDGVVRHYGKTKAIVEGRPRKPVREYLLKQGRFAHFIEEDLEYFQAKVDEMWNDWEIPGVIPFKKAPAGK